jgi:hypothetical protein
MANFNVGVTRNITPSDSEVMNVNMILVGTSGDVALDLVGGDTVTITAVPANVWVPVGNSIRIKATGTTATDILAV